MTTSDLQVINHTFFHSHSSRASSRHRKTNFLRKSGESCSMYDGLTSSYRTSVQQGWSLDQQEYSLAGWPSLHPAASLYQAFVRIHTLPGPCPPTLTLPSRDPASMFNRCPHPPWHIQVWWPQEENTKKASSLTSKSFWSNHERTQVI